jgi:hypothetical protein
VKCEFRLPEGGTTPQWVVTERKPVLRSRGIEREVYDKWVAFNPDDPQQRYPSLLNPPDKWIFSEELPQPWAKLNDTPAYRQGLLTPPGSNLGSSNGWVRAVALDEEYAYRPDGDTEPP